MHYAAFLQNIINKLNHTVTLCKILNPPCLPGISLSTMLRMFMLEQDLFEDTAIISFSLIADWLCRPSALWSSAAALRLPLSLRREAVSRQTAHQDDWHVLVRLELTQLRKNCILQLKEVIWKMTPNSPSTVRRRRLKSGRVCDTLCHAWVFVLCVCACIICASRYICSGDISVPGRRGPCGVCGSVGGWWGAGAWGITCPWLCSCSRQTRSEHIMFQRREGKKMLHDRGIS